MKDKGLATVLGLGIILFVLLYAVTGGFGGAWVFTGDVTGTGNNSVAPLTIADDAVETSDLNSAIVPAVGQCVKVGAADLTLFDFGACAAGGSAHTIQDESVGLAARTNLNFTGAGITCTDDAGNNQTDCDVTAGGGDNVSVNIVAATDADLTDGDIDFTLNAVPNPDQITATVGCTDCVTLATETAGAYVATLGAPAAGITVTGSGAENAAVTLGLADDLAALESLGCTGFGVRTAASAWTCRTLTAPAAGFTITNSDGVAGNPTFVLSNDLSAVEGLGTAGLAARTALDTWTTRSLAAPATGMTITNNDGVAGDPTFALADDLNGLESLGCTGFGTRTAASAWTCRTIVAPVAGITIANGDGVAGNPTLSLADDLLLVEGMTCSGFVVRSGTASWACRTFTAVSGTAITNGNGTLGAPVISLDQLDTAADEECSTWEAASSQIEWQTCGAGGSGDNSLTRYRRGGSIFHGPSFTNRVFQGNTTIAAGTFYAFAFPVATTFNIDAASTFINSAGAGGTLGRICVYNDNGSIYPDALLQDSGTFAVDSTGDKTSTFTSVAMTAQTLYWIAVFSDGAPQLLRTTGSFGVLGLAASGGVNSGWTVAQAFGACPGTFPGGGTMLSIDGALWLRVRKV